MVQRHGMRKGISLVEMMIAIVVFGVISAAGYKYYKNYYDVGLASKQTLMSIVVDQGTQLSNAYDIYETKKGVAPTDIDELSGADVRIIKETPKAIPEVSANGWAIKTDLELDKGTTTTNDIALTYTIDASGLSTEEKIAYCNVLNNIAASSWDYNASSDSSSTDDEEEVITKSEEMYDKTTWNFKNIMCYTPDDSAFTIAFVKKVNPN